MLFWIKRTFCFEYYSIIACGLTDLNTWTFESLKNILVALQDLYLSDPALDPLAYTTVCPNCQQKGLRPPSPTYCCPQGHQVLVVQLHFFHCHVGPVFLLCSVTVPSMNWCLSRKQYHKTELSWVCLAQFIWQRQLFKQLNLLCKCKWNTGSQFKLEFVELVQRNSFQSRFRVVTILRFKERLNFKSFKMLITFEKIFSRIKLGEKRDRAWASVQTSEKRNNHFKAVISLMNSGSHMTCSPDCGHHTKITITLILSAYLSWSNKWQSLLLDWLQYRSDDVTQPHCAFDVIYLLLQG